MNKLNISKNYLGARMLFVELWAEFVKNIEVQLIQLD